jgi:hypothetical protein
VDNDALGRAAVDGTAVDESWLPGANATGGVAVDASHIYWSDDGSDMIERANLDGSAVDGSFIWTQAAVAGLAIDGLGPAASPPVNTVLPSITGSPRALQMLSCSPGLWSGTPPIAFAYQWLRDGGLIAGATEASYRLTSSDAGHRVACRVAASNAYGAGSAVSMPVAVMVPPSATSPPQILGPPTVGARAACSPGTWVGTRPIALAFQWYLDGDRIRGATKPTLASFPSAALGVPLECRVTATNAAGSATAHAYIVAEPPVRTHSATFPTVSFSAGDHVYITADGCVQTGGTGDTWKRYVDPSGDPSNSQYYGDVALESGAGLASLPFGPVSDVIGRVETVSTPTAMLVLGYEDDQYSDNGYYSHDDGANDQCAGGRHRPYGGPAYVSVASTPGVVAGPGPRECATTKVKGPFALVTKYVGLNDEPLNPEWAWQCDYFTPFTGQGLALQDRFADPFWTCNRFHQIPGGVDTHGCAAPDKFSLDLPVGFHDHTCTWGVRRGQSLVMPTMRS